MSLPTTSTAVSYPAGEVTGKSPVLAVPVLPDGRWAVVVAETPFHPLDHTWPDQPADSGTLTVAGRELPVVDCQTGGVGPDGEFAVAAEIPVRRGDEAWAWLVLHVVDAVPGVEPESLVGEDAVLSVDAERRAALSAGHTACHLMAFALNEALADRWRKEVRTDALGRPDFDQLAMDTSKIAEWASRDEYRIGKSLRKKGFGTEDLAAALPDVAARANATLAGWLATGAEVRLEVPDTALTARRVWHCALPDGDAHIPCGGSHAHSLADLASVVVELDLSEDGTELVARTAVTAAG
ncbi:metal-dependent hydrolase [Yinghuangia seranimata]|uniref:metal-dependent hydrolase n=1 Tax=Yinghuangia seranimata TaxID=408067 RepID=UPI00248B5E0C|nr:metal-dependent hydrolase [Yinghuangia seranimata]MDI2127978.1 metal-dependent hydrolase [Yinghuangia seranimata]